MRPGRKIWTEYDNDGMTTGRELREASMNELLAEYPNAVVDKTDDGSDRVNLGNGTFYVHHWNVWM